MALLTTSRFGFRRAEIASFNSASTSAFLFALASSKLVMLELRESDGCFGRGRLASPLGSAFNETGSLPSRFTPENEVEVADLISAMALLGPLETLLRCCWSVDSARCKVLLGFRGAGRWAAAPGFCSRLLAERLDDFDFGGDTMTGPPSLRLIESHSSGKRAEKLFHVSSVLVEDQGFSLQRQDDVDAKVLQGLRGSCLLILAVARPSRYLGVFQ